MDNCKMGNLISEMRRQKNMTQKELADRLNVTDKAVSKWERGICCPDISSIPRLAELLEISAEELLDMKKSTGDHTPMREKIHAMILLILKAVGLAMGIAALVISIISQGTEKSQITMLALAVTCFGIVQLDKINKN